MVEEKSKLAFEILKKEAIKLLKSLRTAIISCRIYPQGSKMTEYAVNDAYFTLIKNIEFYGEISLVDGGRTLFLGNNRISVVDIGLDINTILKLFEQNRIESVTFNKNLEKEKLAEFLDIISSLKCKDNIEEIAKNIVGIEVNRRIYLSIDKEETVITKRIDEILEKLTSNIGVYVGEKLREEGELSLALENIFVSLREIYDNIDLLQDEKIKEEMHVAVAKKVGTFPPQIIKEILERELPPKLEEVNFKNLLLSVLTKSKIEEIFKEIINWYNEIIKKGDELKAIEELDKLREFIKTLLSSPAARNVSFEIYKQLLELQLIEEIPEWVEKGEKRKEEKSALLTQVDEIINSEPQKLLEENIRNNLPQMIKQLSLAELDDLILNIIHKLLSNLEIPLPGVRLLAMQTVNSLIGTLANCHKEDIIQYVVDSIKELVKKESNTAVYTEVGKFFTYISKFFLLENKYTDVVDILTLFREERISCKEDEKSKCLIIAKLFNNISEEVKDILFADIRSNDENRLRGALDVINKLDDAAVNIVVDAILETKNEKLLIILSGYIKEHLDLYRDKLLELLSYRSSTDVLINLLEVLKFIDDAALLSKLKILTSYPEAVVREKLITFVKESNLNGKDKSEILLFLLDDKLPRIRSKAVKVLPYIPAEDTENIIDKLLSKIDKEDKAVQEQICITLGEMKIRKAIPYLNKIAKGRKGLFSKYPRTVQLRAQWALEQIKSMS